MRGHQRRHATLTGNTQEELEYTANKLIDVVKKLRELSPLYELAKEGVDLTKVQFTAHFGRNMEYYTGFVFELWARDKEGPVQIAGGGRYDSMMEMLGSKNPVSAIGCALRTERVLAAAGGA